MSETDKTCGECLYNFPGQRIRWCDKKQMEVYPTQEPCGNFKCGGKCTHCADKIYKKKNQGCDNYKECE